MKELFTAKDIAIIRHHALMALDGLHATDEEFSPIHFWDRVGEIATIDTTINVSLHFNKCTNCYYIDIWDTEIILSFDDHEEFRISTEDFTTGDEAEFFQMSTVIDFEGISFKILEPLIKLSLIARKNRIKLGKQ